VIGADPNNLSKRHETEHNFLLRPHSFTQRPFAGSNRGHATTYVELGFLLSQGRNEAATPASDPPVALTQHGPPTQLNRLGSIPAVRGHLPKPLTRLALIGSPAIQQAQCCRRVHCTGEEMD
jgi:hypothetical protein